MNILIILEKYFLLFMTYSIGGWIIEEIHCSILEKKIVDRGFLIGPVCPIYGFGGIFITIALRGLYQYPILVFIFALVLCAFLEYFTSYIMEKLFNARWWDYSNEKININGRICLKTLIPFGIFGVCIIYIINPLIFKILNSITIPHLHAFSWSIAILMIIDICISMKVISKVTSTAKKVSEEHSKDNTNEITKKVKIILKETFAGNRLMNAFPNLVTFKTKVKEIAEKASEKGKEIANQTKEKGKEIAEKASEKGKQIAKQTKQKTQELAEKASEKSKKIVIQTKQKNKKL